MDYLRYFLLRNDEKNKYNQLFKGNFRELFNAVINIKQYRPLNLKEIENKKIKFEPTQTIESGIQVSNDIHSSMYTLGIYNKHLARSNFFYKET